MKTCAFEVEIAKVEGCGSLSRRDIKGLGPHLVAAQKVVAEAEL